MKEAPADGQVLARAWVLILFLRTAAASAGLSSPQTADLLIKQWRHVSGFRGGVSGFHSEQLFPAPNLLASPAAC